MTLWVETQSKLHIAVLMSTAEYTTGVGGTGVFTSHDISIREDSPTQGLPLIQECQ